MVMFARREPKASEGVLRTRSLTSSMEVHRRRLARGVPAQVEMLSP